MINTVLFDLDGTLLPMDMELFTKSYFKLLAAKLLPYGYEAQPLVAAIWKGTGAMVANDGSMTNEDAFWKCFAGILGDRVYSDKPVFEDFYAHDFRQAKAFCGFNPKAGELISSLKASGTRIALATNPIFPAVATESRIRWAGLEPRDFELYTTYENSTSCKPNPAYYESVLTALGAKPEECLMVGNDVEEDMVAEKLGMQVFLLTDCLLNRHEKDINAYPHGDMDALRSFLAERGLLR